VRALFLCAVRQPMSLKQGEDEMKENKNAPAMEQWAKLYDAAITIKQQAPWESLWDTDLITILLPEREEPVFISVLGKNGECYGIGVYPGYRELLGLYCLLDTPNEELEKNPLRFQNCLMCYYGDRDSVAPQEREIIKALGLKFRGANNWIYFRSLKEGFFPWLLDAEQAELMIHALQNFSAAYDHISSGKIKVDFENGETLIRMYSDESGEWLNAAAPMPMLPDISERYVPKNELLIKRLQNMTKSPVQLEMDILYFPMLVKDKPDETPHFPRVLVLFDRKDGILLEQKLIDKEISNDEVVIDTLADYITKYGRPSKLFVRDRYFLSYVDYFCYLLEVQVSCGRGLIYIDEFEDLLFEFVSEL
jgi:hypothetical protein